MAWQGPGAWSAVHNCAKSLALHGFCRIESGRGSGGGRAGFKSYDTIFGWGGYYLIDDDSLIASLVVSLFAIREVQG
jgi:hypothetical protein